MIVLVPVDPVNEGEAIKQKKGIDMEEDFKSCVNPLFTGIENNQLNGSNNDCDRVITGSKLDGETWGNKSNNGNWEGEDLMDMGQEEGPNLLEVTESKRRRQESGAYSTNGLGWCQL